LGYGKEMTVHKWRDLELHHKTTKRGDAPCLGPNPTAAKGRVIHAEIKGMSTRENRAWGGKKRKP